MGYQENPSPGACGVLGALLHLPPGLRPLRLPGGSSPRLLYHGYPSHGRSHAPSPARQGKEKINKLNLF